MAGRIAFDANGVETRGGVLDREIQAEGIAFVGAGGWPAEGLEVLADRADEAVTLLLLAPPGLVPDGLQAIEQAAAGGEFPG